VQCRRPNAFGRLMETGPAVIGMRSSTRRIEAGRCADRKATWPVAIHVGNPIPRTVRPFERVAQNATQAIHRF